MVLHKKSGTIDLFQKDENGNPIEGKYIEFRNIVEYFDEGDTFIFNDTKVFPARLYGTKEKTDAKIEVFLLRELNQEMRLWDVLVEPARKIRIGNKLFFDESGSMVAEVIDNTTSRGRTLRFLYDCPHEEFKKELYALGEAPLPRYIIDNREETHATKEDLENFQCIFAKNEGAVTAPATGLHFSRELLKRMEIKGINNAFITLHCGLGSFGLSNTMVTNFYHPYSTLLMETAAFGGYELVMEAYDLAVKHGYMFGCFGDSLLILND